MTGTTGDEGVPPQPRCECNVFDHTGRPIAWRTWACPFHKIDGWLDRYGDPS